MSLPRSAPGTVRRGPAGAPARSGLFALRVLALGLPLATSCRLPSLPGGMAASGPKVPAAVAGAVLPGPLRNPAVAAALYNCGVEGGDAGWRPKRLWQVGGPAFDAKTAFVSFQENVLPFEEGGKVRAFLVASIRPPEHEGPRAAPIVGAMALTDAPGGWRVDSVEPEMAVLGGGGALTGSGSAVRISRSRHALLLETEVVADGRKESTMAFFAEAEGKMVEVLRLDEAAVTNEGGCGEGQEPCFGFRTEWDPVRVKGQELYDLRLTTTGTRLDPASKQPVEVEETRTYTYRGSRYEVQKEGSDARS